MFSNYGPIRQLGYVVRDVEAAMRDWAARLRIGPWHYNPRLGLSAYRFRGVDYPLEDFHMSYALANSGDIQIELIQQRCQTPSLYREFLNRHGEGLQHICVWPENYDEVHALARASGLLPVQEGAMGTTRFAYFDDITHGGTSLEVAEMTPKRRRVIEVIRNSAAAWDGSAPIRDYNPASNSPFAHLSGKGSR